MSISQTTLDFQFKADGSLWFNSKTYVQAAAGGQFVLDPSQETSGQYAPPATVNYMTNLLANYVLAGVSAFTNRPQGSFLNLDEVAYLRAAVDKGVVTVAQVLNVLGNIKVDSACALNFHLTDPTSISNADVVAYGSTGLSGLSTALYLKDFFTHPVPFIDDSAIASNQPWSVPAGQTLAQASANYWSTSGIPGIAQIITADAHALGMLVAADLAALHSPYVDSAEKVYLAYFGRPADLTGLATTEDQIAAKGGDKAAIASMFASSPESANFYAGMTDAQKVNTVYHQLFNRDAEKAGLDYWINQLKIGAIDQVNMCIKILDGALNADLQTVNNRVVVAKYFTENIDFLAYQGDKAASNARMLLSAVGSNTADIAKAEQVIDSAGYNADLQYGVVSDDIALVGLHVSPYFMG